MFVSAAERLFLRHTSQSFTRVIVNICRAAREGFSFPNSKSHAALTPPHSNRRPPGVSWGGGRGVGGWGGGVGGWCWGSQLHVVRHTCPENRQVEWS